MYEIDYRYLRPKKAAALKNWCESPLEVREEPKIWQGRQATILPLRRKDGLLFGLGGVVSESGEYVSLSAIPGRVEHAYPFENPEYRDEKVCCCGYLVNQWGHFLFEGTARLWYFLENDPTIDHFVFFLDEGEQREIRGNYRAFLELLGIWDKLLFISKPTTFREVVVPELGYRMLRYYSPKFLNVFTRVADNAPVDPSWNAQDKIYFSRAKLQKAKEFEFGFDVLDDFFQKNGYTILYPETLGLSQMVFYVRHAKTIATPSGTLVLNMFFGYQGQTLEIMERFLLNDDNQADISRMKELKVTYVDVNIPIYPVDFTGPYMVGYNDNFQKFAQDKGCLPPDSKFLTKKHFDKCFKSFIRSYQDLYRYRWFMSDWYLPFTDYLYEGYQAGYAYFHEYLDGERPYLWHHYFELHYFKQFVKRILSRMGLRK